MSAGILPSISRRRPDELLRPTQQGVLANSAWDALLVGLAVAQGLLLWRVPSLAVISLGVWWNSNTISHNAIHRPLFRWSALNRAFAVYLTVLLGVPQTIWRERHRAHHAGIAWRPRWTMQGAIDVAAVLAVWGALAARAPVFFFTVYMPGWCLGLSLCAVHGHFEHCRGAISHYGRAYNLLFFNDGYHVEHHRRASLHWRQLPAQAIPGATASRWPAVLRWLDCLSLESLERRALRRPWMQRFVLASHERATSRLLQQLPPVHSVAIVGGGLFPRTALVLRKLLPGARLVIIDKSQENLLAARRFLDPRIETIEAWYDADRHGGYDLVVIPLSLQGDREALYDRPPAAAVLIHDWLWRPRGDSEVVSYFLLKRLNLVRG